jgi:outer membrane protein OmpA-like peptidoglycan-associated protein
MKKFFMMIAATMMAASVSAQNTAITSNKFGDNWYAGVNVGVATPQQKLFNDEYGFMKGFAPKLGVRVGKNLTTVFGLAADIDLYMLSKEDSKSLMGTKTFIDNLNLDLMGTFNLSNLFAGYPGEPRAFEVIGLAGLGWSHAFGQNYKVNAINGKAALDFAFNLGASKAVQIYLEPAVIYGLETYGLGNMNILTYNTEFKFDSRAALFQLSLGLNYKFANSNGTHNFAKAALRDQAEIDGLNAKINELRADVNAKDGQLSAKDQQIADLKAKLAACEARPTATVVEKKVETLQPIVIFRQGKSVIDPAQYASIEMIAKYMKNHPESNVLVQGYASPEGSAELNQKLSEQRAEVVKNALIKKYKIAASRITTEGLGATDKLSDEVDFNRVAMFIDTTKQ